MTQRRRLYSLLLTSFILVFACSFSWAQTVTFESVSVLRGDAQELDITIDPTMDISAFEIVFDVTEGHGGAVFDAFSVNWDPTLTVLTHRYIDLSGFTNSVLPGTVRIAGMMIDDADACLTAAATVVAQVGFTSNDVCDGSVVLDGTTLTISKCNSCVMEASSQFIQCTYSMTLAATVVAGTVDIDNAPPFLVTMIDDIVMHWGETEYRQMDVDDNDLHTTPGGYESLTYTIVSVPPIPGLSVNSTTGAITCFATGSDVGCHEVTVRATDECDIFIEDVFDISVENTPPVIICQEEVTNGIWGYDITGTVDAYDPDGLPDSTHGGPFVLNFYFVSLIDQSTMTPAPGVVDVDLLTGDWTWYTEELPEYLGDFELCLKVTDQANTDECSPENADTCCQYIHMISTGDVVIEKTHNTMMGQFHWVEITMENSNLEIGGYDFLIKYDQSALSFNTAVLGEPLEDCDWEYFTYREGAAGNCGPNACPTGIVRLVAMAETNNGYYHPTCFGGPDFTKWVMAKMQFFVTADQTFECQYAPITWIWYDCGDNGISSVTGDTLFISRDVLTYEGFVSDLTANDDAFPTQDGAPSPECDTSGGEDKPEPLRIIDYWHGGIDIICVDDIDDRGDINLNGNSYEIADAVLFANYFVYGLGVFSVNTDGQVAATDVNADGLTLSVGDLVYLIRVIIGDAIPYAPSGFTKVGAVEVSYTHADNGLLSIDGADMGAVHMVVAGDVTPELRASDMELMYNSTGVETRILVWSPAGNAFTGECLNVTGEILSIDMATADGTLAKGIEIPTEFALHQNYPNPFNPTTTVSFSLPTAADYSLAIFNVSGQKVVQFSDYSEAGTVSIEWNAGNLASGIYFYKLQADNFSETKKMVLLK